MNDRQLSDDRNCFYFDLHHHLPSIFSNQYLASASESRAYNYPTNTRLNISCSTEQVPSDRQHRKRKNTKLRLGQYVFRIFGDTNIYNNDGIDGLVYANPSIPLKRRTNSNYLMGTWTLNISPLPDHFYFNKLENPT